MVREQLGEEARQVVRPQDAEGLPLMSDKKTFQLVAVDASGNVARAWVMFWRPEAATDGQSWTVTNAGATANVRVTASATIDVPKWVREELGETGVLRPPHRIVWQALDLGKNAGGAARLQHGSQDFVDFVPSFTSDGATGN